MKHISINLQAKLTLILVVIFSTYSLSANANSIESADKPTIYYLPHITKITQASDVGRPDSLFFKQYDRFKNYMNRKLELPKKIVVLEDVDADVKVWFEIDKKGKLKKAKVLNSNYPELSKEVLKALKKAPRWDFDKASAENIADNFEATVRFSILCEKTDLPKLKGDTEGKDKTIRKKVYAIPDQLAEFEGGHTAMLHYVMNHVKYDQQLAENGVEGRSLIRFVIDSDGQVRNPRVFKSAHPSLDLEALRVVKSMPKWKPAQVDGEPVAMFFLIPITFQIPR